MSELRGLLEDERLREPLGSLKNLPSAPRLYLALTRTLDDEDSNASDLSARFRTVSGADSKFPAQHEQTRLRSLLAARIASRLFTDPLLSEDACTAGMLHDVGRMVPPRVGAPAPGAVDQPEAHAHAAAWLLGTWSVAAQAEEEGALWKETA